MAADEDEEERVGEVTRPPGIGPETALEETGRMPRFNLRTLRLKSFKIL